MSNNFRQILHEELARRCRLNPAYSLRSFARQIGISPASLSGFLNGSRSMSHRMRHKVGAALGIGPAQIEDVPVAKPTELQRLMSLAATVDRSLLPEAIEKISGFRREFENWLSHKSKVRI